VIHTYQDHLIAQAKQHWDRDEPCPVDIITKLYAEGIDASALEDHFAARREALEEDNEPNLDGEEETHG
jgi:hypothetical protein